jgi:hypothetical protein
MTSNTSTATTTAAPAPMATQRRSLLDELRNLAASSPVLARARGWDYLRELGTARKQGQLEALFARGWAPQGPDGVLEGLIVGPLFNIPEAYLANPLLKIDPTWRGKTFDAAAGTGFNRLAPIAKFAMPFLAPLYRGLRPLRGEIVGFDFCHTIDTALVEPKVQVRALDYSVTEYRNPSVRTFPIKRTRDEIVELLPGLYLGRALLRMPDGEIRNIAWFALREFTDEAAR